MQINLEGQVRKVNHLQPDVILARHRVGSGHLQDQSSNRGAGFWTSALPPGNPGPKQAKALAMPGHNRLRSYDDQHPVPILPTPGQPHPKEAIRPSQPRPRALSLERCELLTKGQILQGDISEVSGRTEKTQQQTKEREHGVQGEGRHFKKSIVFNSCSFGEGQGSRKR